MLRVHRLNHVIKSDRINVLRKQYDAFLEEDRKRKERNDYILGRLDDMRYCSSAMHTRHKPILFGEMTSIQNCGAHLPEQLERREFQSTPSDHQMNRPSNENLKIDVPRTLSDFSTFLKEITKKYILIPRLKTSIENGVSASMPNRNYVGGIQTQPSPTAPKVSSQQPIFEYNEDWKSKYDILEKLKKKENEAPADKYDNDELFPVKETQALSIDDINNTVSFSPKQDTDEYKSQNSGDGYVLQSHNSKEYTTKYEHDVAEKDLTSDKARAETETHNIKRTQISDSKVQEPAVDQASNINASLNTYPTNTAYDNKSQNKNLDNYVPFLDAQASNKVEQNVYDSKHPKENIVAPEYPADTHTEYPANNTHEQVNDVPHYEQYEQYEAPIEIEGNYPDPKNVYLDPDDYSPIEVLDTPALVEQIHTEPIVTDNPVTTVDTEKENGHYQYPVEMLNVQEFTPPGDVKLTDGENVNPIYLSNDVNVHQNQMEATNENQNYMASKGNTEPVYENEPQVETTMEDPQYSTDTEPVDAEQREMLYTEEKPEYNYDQQQENNYQDNQDYTNAPAQDYTYYESPATLQEQEYPVEINEHEESNTRYDQNYEQQYTTEHEGYVQPQDYNQTEQQQYVYDQTEQPYQDYEYQQPDNVTAQNVQEDLDQEAGYVEQQDYEPTEEVQPSANQNNA